MEDIVKSIFLRTAKTELFILLFGSSIYLQLVAFGSTSVTGGHFSFHALVLIISTTAFYENNRSNYNHTLAKSILSLYLGLFCVVYAVSVYYSVYCYIFPFNLITSKGIIEMSITTAEIKKAK